MFFNWYFFAFLDLGILPRPYKQPVMSDMMEWIVVKIK